MSPITLYHAMGHSYGAPYVPENTPRTLYAAKGETVPQVGLWFKKKHTFL